MMSDTSAPAEAILGMALALLLLVIPILALVFARYRYDVDDMFLVIHRRILGGIPFGTIRIRLDNVATVEAVQSGWSPPGVLLYGYLYAPVGVLLNLKHRRYLLFRKILVTPDAIDGFMDDIRRGGAVEARPPSGVRTLLDELSLRTADAFAVLSGFALLGLLLALVAHVSWEREVLGTGHPLATAATVVAAVLVLCMGLLMLLDCVRAATSEEDPVLYLWLIGMLLVVPLAWLYYLRLWRPHRLALGSREGG